MLLSCLSIHFRFVLEMNEHLLVKRLFVSYGILTRYFHFPYEGLVLVVFL